MRKRIKGRSGLVICLGLAAGLAAGPGLTAQAAATGAASAAPLLTHVGVWHAHRGVPGGAGPGYVPQRQPVRGLRRAGLYRIWGLTRGRPDQRLDGFSIRPMAATESGGAWTAAKRVFLPANPAGPCRAGPDRRASRHAELVRRRRRTGRTGREPGVRDHRVRRNLEPPPAAQAAGNADGSGDVRGITCARRGSCLAVGWYDSAQTVGSAPMAVSLAGGRWGQATPIPVPSCGTTGQLDSVACPSAGLCVTVGEFNNGRTGDGMEAALSGGTWHPATAMQQPNSQARLSQLDSVSCQSAMSCLAVGNDAEGGALYTVFSLTAGGSRPGTHDRPWWRRWAAIHRGELHGALLPGRRHLPSAEYEPHGSALRGHFLGRALAGPGPAPAAAQRGAAPGRLGDRDRRGELCFQHVVHRDGPLRHRPHLQRVGGHGTGWDR